MRIFCKHKNAAVCPKTKYRDIFKFILKDRCPDIFLCDNAEYEVTNQNGDKFVIEDLEYINENEELGYWITDFYTGIPILLSKENFKVLCKKKGKCMIQEHVILFKNG